AMTVLEDKYIFAAIEFIPDRGALLLDGVPAPLGGRAMKILTILLRQAGEVVNGHYLLEH
ncbi:MAG: hypothetical protein WAM20_12220, partial [Acidobacteriaceae bacterium]